MVGAKGGRALLYEAAAAVNPYRGNREQVFGDDDGGGGYIIYYNVRAGTPSTAQVTRRASPTRPASPPNGTAGHTAVATAASAA